MDNPRCGVKCGRSPGTGSSSSRSPSPCISPAQINASFISLSPKHMAVTPAATRRRHSLGNPLSSKRLTLSPVVRVTPGSKHHRDSPASRSYSGSPDFKRQMISPAAKRLTLTPRRASVSPKMVAAVASPGVRSHHVTLSERANHPAADISLLSGELSFSRDTEQQIVTNDPARISSRNSCDDHGYLSCSSEEDMSIMGTCSPCQRAVSEPPIDHQVTREIAQPLTLSVSVSSSSSCCTQVPRPLTVSSTSVDQGIGSPEKSPVDDLIFTSPGTSSICSRPSPPRRPKSATPPASVCHRVNLDVTVSPYVSSKRASSVEQHTATVPAADISAISWAAADASISTAATTEQENSQNDSRHPQEVPRLINRATVKRSDTISERPADKSSKSLLMNR